MGTHPKGSPTCLWTIEGFLTTTSNFLKIQAGPQHLVTLRVAPGPKQGTDPREVGFHFNRRPSKDRQPLTPTCVNCQLPTRECSGGNAPLISGFHHCGGEKLLLWAEMDGFQGFLCFWCQPSSTARWLCAICRVVSDGGGDRQGNTHRFRYVPWMSCHQDEPSLPQGTLSSTSRK